MSLGGLCEASADGYIGRTISMRAHPEDEAYTCGLFY
jgi:hypothetical protein